MCVKKNLLKYAKETTEDCDATIARCCIKSF